MNIYYTAKDIEELAAKGVQELQIGPGVTLTDFARESARQLGVTLVDSRKQQAAPASQPAAPSRTTAANDKYNKPSGCMHASSAPATTNAPNSQATTPSGQTSGNVNPNTVNKLIDLMGKAIKRG